MYRRLSANGKYLADKFLHLISKELHSPSAEMHNFQATSKFTGKSLSGKIGHLAFSIVLFIQLI